MTDTESVAAPPPESRVLRVVVVAYLLMKAIVDWVAAGLIFADGGTSDILGQPTSGSMWMGAADLFFGVFYVVLAAAVIRRWRYTVALAMPVLIVDLFVSTNWGAPAVLIVLLLIPSTRRKLLSRSVI